MSAEHDHESGTGLPDEPGPAGSSARGSGAGRDRSKAGATRQPRSAGAQRLLMRFVATCGIVGIGVAIAAIMVSSKSQGWIVGLVVSIVSAVLAAIVWTSKRL